MIVRQALGSPGRGFVRHGLIGAQDNGPKVLGLPGTLCAAGTD